MSQEVRDGRSNSKWRKLRHLPRGALFVIVYLSQPKSVDLRNQATVEPFLLYELHVFGVFYIIMNVYWICGNHM